MVKFDAAVLERSHTLPVVVDFWAAWCGPCRMLGPILESLAAEAAGRWELVKLDTEEQPDIAREYGIMSIPAVKMFRDGRIVSEFIGALPASEVRRWLDETLPDPDAAHLDELVAAWEQRGGEIAPELERFVEEHPEMPAARLRLAQAVVGRDPDRARRLVREADAGVELEELSDAVTALADLMEARGATPEIAAEIEGAKAAFAAHDLPGTLEHLVELAMRDRGFGDELARRASVALFQLLGQDHDLTRESRRRLAMALHS